MLSTCVTKGIYHELNYKKHSNEKQLTKWKKFKDFTLEKKASFWNNLDVKWSLDTE